MWCEKKKRKNEICIMGSWVLGPFFPVSFVAATHTYVHTLAPFHHIHASIKSTLGMFFFSFYLKGVGYTIYSMVLILQSEGEQ